MEKKYTENKRLKEYFEHYVKTMNVHPSFKPLLVDILMRRAYEFILTPIDIKQDMNSLLNNLEKITIGKMPKDMKHVAGYYNPANKEIVLSSEYIKKFNKGEISYEILYEILTHEVYHVLSTDENGNDRLSSINKFTKNLNISLLEAIVEKAADRCVFSNRQQFAPYYAQNAFGYSNITFITDALEATYGVTEKAFFRHAIMGRKKLATFLSDYSNEQLNETMDFLDAIEMNYARLHNALYNPLKQELDITNEIKEAMTSIYILCEKKMQRRIENREIESFQEAKFVAGKLKFEHNRLYYVMRDASQKFSAYLNDPSIEQDIAQNVADTRVHTMMRISDFNQVVMNADRIGSIEEILKLVRWAQYGNLANYGLDKLDRFGISLQIPNNFTLTKEIIDMYAKIDYSEDNWKNDNLYNSIHMIAKSVFQKNLAASIINQIKARFKNGQNNPLLGIPKEDSYQNQNVFGILSQDEVRKLNETVQEMLKDMQNISEESIEREDCEK